MTRRGRVPGFTAALLTTLSLSTGALAAQDTTLAPPDSATALQEEEQPVPPATLAVEPAVVPRGPLPPAARYTFTRDSILWSRAQSLGELLAEIPGVYVTRAGLLGEPEYVQYGGRGGSALEVYWDGMLYEPVGGDTLFVDPGRLPLTYLQRVDVEVLPSKLRVFLVSERHETRSARSKIRVMSGSFKSAAYTALFQKRWQSGFGVDLAAHFLGSDGPQNTAKSDQFDLWAKRKGTRTDYLLNLYARTRGDGLGFATEGGFGSTSWSADSGSGVPDQQLRQAWLGLRYAAANWTAGLRGRVADARTHWAVEGNLNWVPLPGIVLTSDGRWRRHTGDRTSWSLHASAGLYRGPFSLVGEATWQDALQAPALLDDTTIATADYGVRAGVDLRPVTGWVGLVRRDAYDPRAYPDLTLITELRPSPPATYLVADLHVRPSSAITLSGWYSDPIEGTPADFQPPRHVRAELTFRSKFWRTFRSGAFDLRVQLATESWGRGTAGLDVDGDLVGLPGATFWDIHASLQIMSFTVFWNLRNARLSEEGFVPRLPQPGNAQLFGVTWVFSS